MPVDIKRPRWRNAEACEVAGYDDPQTVRNLRADYGFKLGKLEAGGWRFSVLDIAELTTLPALRGFGFAPADAIKLARDELRPNLADVLNNRLAHGFWSLGAIELEGGPPFGTRTLFLDQIAERVIVKLALPLPVEPKPRDTKVALRMVDAIFDYVESVSGRLRWNAWHDIARGGKVPLAQAAAELGAPPWFMRALIAALMREHVHDTIVAAVRPRSPNVREHLEGVTLQ